MRDPITYRILILVVFVFSFLMCPSSAFSQSATPKSVMFSGNDREMPFDIHLFLDVSASALTNDSVEEIFLPAVERILESLNHPNDKIQIYPFSNTLHDQDIIQLSADEEKGPLTSEQRAKLLNALNVRLHSYVDPYQKEGGSGTGNAYRKHLQQAHSNSFSTKDLQLRTVTRLDVLFKRIHRLLKSTYGSLSPAQRMTRKRFIIVLTDGINDARSLDRDNNDQGNDHSWR